MVTHFTPPYARLNGVRYQAACGLYVLPTERDQAPTCPTCQQFVADENAREADDEAALAALLAMPPGPRLTLPPDNHLDGYSIRSRR